MTVEQRVFVRLPSATADVVAGLARRSEAALARAAKAPVGDRVDIVRYEQAQGELELLAVVAANVLSPVIRDQSGPEAERRSCVVAADARPTDIANSTAVALESWLRAGSLVVEVVAPFVVGTTARPEGTGKVKPVAETWESTAGARRQDAVRERFLAQLADAVAKPGSVTAITPSGVSNSVLTEGLRGFAGAGDSPPTEVAVVYRDGSSSAAFPLRALELASDPQPAGGVLSFSLLSIRHVALDATVDGAWLRNSDVSRPRPAGDTDELVYRESRRQITEVCRDGPATIVMYQTGLEPAIVGFYRAVARHLASSPGSLVVLPRYFQKGRSYAEGTPWRTR